MIKSDFIEMARKSGFEIGMVTRSIYARSPSCQSKLKRFADLVVAAERNKLAAWMIQFGFATGHGDTMDDLVDALESEIVDRMKFEISREREACAKACEELRPTKPEYDMRFHEGCTLSAAAIRARSKT